MFKMKSKKKCLFILITIFCLFVIAPSIAVNAGTKNGWLDQENLDSIDTHDGTALDKKVLFEFWITSSKAIKQNNKLYIQPGFVIFDTQNGDNMPSDYLYYELKRGSSTIKSGKISRATLQSGMFAIENLGYVYKLDDKKVRPLGYYIDTMVEVEGAAPSTPSGGATHISGKQYSFDVSSNAQYGESLTFDIVANKTTFDDDDVGSSLRPKDDVYKYKYVINTSSSAPTASSINSNPTGSDTDGKFNYTVSSLTTQYYAHIIAVSYTGKISGVKTIKITPPVYKITLDARGGTLKDDLSDNKITNAFYERYGRWLGYATKESYSYYQTKDDGTTYLPFYATRTGYTFKGFYTKKSGGDCILKDKYVQVSNTYFTKDTTLFAQYTPNSYKLTIDPNGGTIKYNGATKNASFDTNFKYNYYTYIGDTPTRPGYTFNGWKFSKGSGGINKEGYLLYYGDTTSTTNSKTAYRFNGDYAGNVTATAQWKANTITFYYSANGGKIVEDKGYTINTNKWVTKKDETEKYSKTISYSTSSDATINISNLWDAFGIKRPGYHLVSGQEYIVKTSPTATTKSYTTHDKQPMSNFASYVKDGNATLYLYGNWEKNTSTLKVNPNGGTWKYDGVNYTSTASFTKSYESYVTLSNTPTRPGYIFDGWEQSGTNGTYDASTKKFTFGPTNNATTTLTAQWTPNVYTITLDNQGATTAGSTAYYEKYSKGNYKEAACTNSISKITVPKKTGYIFGGYFTGKDGTGKQWVQNDGTIESTNTTFTSNTTLYAYWMNNRIAIHYNANNGEVTTDKGYTISSNKYVFVDGNVMEKFISDQVTSSVNVHNMNGSFGITRPGYHLEDGKEYLVGSATSTDVVDHDAADPTIMQSYVDKAKNDGTYIINLFANWKINTYTVTIDPNGGTWSGKTTTQKFTQNYNTTKTIATPTREGYTFTGWTGSGNSGSLSGTTFTFGKKMSDGTIYANGGSGTLTANWKPNVYKITLDSQSATNAGTTTYYEKYSVNNYKEQSCTNVITNITIPTKIGHTFGGYYTSTNGGGTQYVDASGKILSTSTTFTSNTTLYAKWIPNVYTITLDANDGNGGTTAYYEKYGVGNYKESACTNTITAITIPTRTGYKFLGYYTTTNGGTQYVDASGKILSTSTTFTKNTTLYAQWTIHKSTLTINPNGGTWNNSTSNQSFTQNYNTTLAVPNPTRTGYTFDGWTISGNAGTLNGTTFTFGANKDGVGTLTAKWKPNVYTITLNNQSATTTGTTVYYEKYGVGNYKEKACTNTITNITIPTRTGHTFGGYYTSTNGSGTQYVDASGKILSTSTTFTKDTTLYAKWTIHKSTLTINPNGGVWEGSASSQTFTQNYNTTKSIPNPTRVGYTFKGWTVGGNAGTLSGTTFTFGPTKDGVGTLTAKWEAKQYEVTLDGNGATSTNHTTNVTATYDASLPSIVIPSREYTVTFNANGTNVTLLKTSEVAKYTFNGYFTATSGGTKYYTSTGTGAKVYDIANDSTFYAQWTPKSVDMPTPTRTGYTFDGWYTSATGGSKISGTTYTPSKNITLYAHWTPNIYTLTINPNGGVMWNGDSKVSSSFTTKFQYDRKTYMGNLKSNGGFEANNAPTRTGYTFNGFTFSGGTGGVNTSGSKFYFGGDANASYNTTTNTWVFNGNHAGDSTATAKWRANKYTINYYNGTTKLGSSNHTYDVSANLTTWSNLGGVVLNSEYGWTFVGWSTSSSSTTTTYTDGQSVVNLTATNGDTINLYAVYKRTVTFKHGVSGSTTNTTTQYWNPYGTTNGTHVGSVKSPALKEIPNWSANGFRNDTIATSSSQNDNATIYPLVNQSPIFYGVYERTITFKSGANAIITDSTPKQYLNSHNNTVSSIKSGTPSAIANWTALGYRDDTTAGGKEYGITSTISPVYTTGNTFYATYSRTLTIKYDANIEPPLTATGSVANTTKTIYMNSYKTNTSDQSVTLKTNGFTYVGFKFLKWNIGNAGSAYNPSLAYDHSTFVVVAKAVWEHDGSGVGTLKTPTLKVNNPNDKGIYYNNGIYFVKGDGKTIVELYGEAILNPTLITRVDKLSLNDGVDILTSNPTYKETYYVEVPKSDVLNGIYDKESVVNHNTHTGLFKTSGNPTIVDITQGKLSFTQKFTMTGQVIKEQYVGARASCMCKTCNDSSHTLSLYGNSIRLHSDPYKPYAYIIDESGTQVSVNAYDTKWTNQKKVTLEFKDDDSGIKYYKLTKGASVVKEVTNSSYSTKNAITLNLVEGATTYTLYVVDNVGNEITYTFTTHVDRTAPRLEDLVDFKVMGDGNVSQGRNEVYTGNNNTNPWPITNVNSIWEYDWQKLKTLEYKAADDGAGLRKVVITHYKQDSTYTNVWKSETLVNVEGDTINGIKDKLITSFNGDTYYLEGKSYLAIEIEDLPGNKTTVKLVIRRDKSNTTISNMKVTPPSLENYTIEQLESIFASGDMSKFKTNVKFSLNDNISTKDTSGIKKVEIVIKDAKTGVEIRRYDVTSNLSISSYTIETDNGSSRFSPLVRPLAGSINVNIDTLGDLPQYTYLNFYYEVTDYVGNKTVVQDKSVVDGGVKGEIPNYSIKTVMYATKDKAYNIPSTNGLTNMPYFKTGEIGYIKVWSIGYVDKLELDFSEGSIGQEMNQAIANGQVASKYILGVHNGLPNQVRYVTDMSKFKVNTSYADYKGIPYASYISYSYDDVNNSFGNSGVDGWANKGTMIRIPQNHELVKKNKLDKYGNELYKWETHIANVYPIKGGVFGKPSGNYYTIWDESGDDLHFRITHLLFGY